MIDELLKGSNNGVLGHGDLKRVAAMYEQTPKTVSKYWKMYKQHKEAGEADPDLHNKRKGNSGQKGVDVAALKEKLEEMPLKNRTTIRAIAAALDIPTTTLHVVKVMFLAAVARPRYDSGRNRQFDGKIGIYPFTVQRAAQRNSRNRAAGTMVTHSVEVNRATYKEKLINNVFPDIRAKFPASSIIFAQQDNAPGHRPPNSPDCNILDLGFFNSIQSLQDRTTPTTVDQLVTEVERAFWAQKPETLGRVWTTLQSVLQEIMLARGDNTFKLPHLRKQTATRRNEALPVELPCSQEAWDKSQAAPA
ncbi:unnamed protein product, partial [Ectocarpus sp. 6 AP-2014]